MKILVLVGLLAALAGACTWFGWFLRGFCDRFPYPPATKRQLDRARRANRADLRAVRPPHPADFVPVPLDHFDHGETE